MKIVHVETGRNLYGGALQVLYLINGLQQHGCENVLVCPSASEIAAAAATTADAVYPLPMRGDLDFLFVFRLWRILRRERPDVVHLHSRRGADVLGGIAARLAGAKTVLTRRVDNPESGWLVRIKYPLYHRIVTISEAIRTVLLREGLAGERVELVHSAVDTERYTGACERTWFRREFNIAHDHKVCVIVAQFIERKGHRHLLDAIPSIVARYPSVSFLFFGKGPLESEMREVCTRLNISAHVHFAGFRNDLERILGCVDIMIHPAELEGLGVSLLQAAASRVPIVGADAGGIPEVVRHGVNGYLTPAGDAAAIADRVLALLEDSEQAAQMGTAGRRIVEQEFSIAAMVAGNLRLYRELCA